MTRYPHEPTDKQIERWYNKMSPSQKAQLDKEVEDFKQELQKIELPKYSQNPNGIEAKVIKFTPNHKC